MDRSPDGRIAWPAPRAAVSEDGTVANDVALRSTIRRADPMTTVVTLQGEIDIVTADEVRMALGRALNGGSRRVIADLSEVCFFGAAGLSVLIEARQAARERAVDLVLVNPSPTVHRVIHITGCDALLDSELENRDGTAPTMSQAQPNGDGPADVGGKRNG